MAERFSEGGQVRALRGVAFHKLTDAFHLYIASCLSEQLLKNTVLGAALYLAGQVLVVFIRMFGKSNSARLPAAIHARGAALFVLAALLCASLFFVYPAVTGHAQFPVLLFCIALLLIRQGATDVISWKLQKQPALRAVLLLAAHVVLSAGAVAAVAKEIPTDAFLEIAAMVAATGVALFAYQVAGPPQKAAQFSKGADRLSGVSSYRIYNGMTSSAVASLNLALLTYVCSMRILPGSGITELFWDLTVWLVLVGGLTLVIWKMLRRRDFTKINKPSVFAAGAALLLLAIAGGYLDWFHGVLRIVSYLLWGTGLACMLSIILSMGYDMQAVLELDMKPEELSGYRENTQAVVEWNLTLSTLLFVFLLTIVTFVSEGRAGPWHELPVIEFLFGSMRFWPIVGIVAALLYALMQPLNRDYAEKLAHYRAQQRAGNVNDALKTRLHMKLVKQTRRMAPDILRAVVRPLMPCRVTGKEHVDTAHGPVVFVGNHLEIYGPLITNLHLPFYFRSWIISGMLDRDIIAAQLKNGVNNVFRIMPEKLRARLPRLIAPVVLFVLQSLDPIPVYRGTAREVINTMRLTVDAMEYEDNILLFPENPGEEQYRQKGVSDFYSGFASIGAEYYKRTGRCTTFYPVYANKFKRTLTIGPGIRFNAENGRREERDRIVMELNAWMNAQA
ncbi:MAG TPA: hypothetical protein VN366_07255 [Feifaniaceae bacterium]|nr:hypothetical protein [Feifaniaceae bacterium]